MIKALLSGASLFPFALPADSQAGTVLINTDTSWVVFDSSNNNFVGGAQDVCLTTGEPPSCPSGATLYGYNWSGWLDPGSVAQWIWAPNVSGATSPAYPAEFTFVKYFTLVAPTGGTVAVASDNSAEVLLNGVSVLSSTTPGPIFADANIAAASLKNGQNEIKIKAQNGPNPEDCASGLYQCNPAGVVLIASFQGGDLQKLCSGFHGGSFYPTQTEPLPCQTGLIGGQSHTCQLDGTWTSISGTCKPPPGKCLGIDGKTYSNEQTETFACPAGEDGSQAHICHDGTWGPATGLCTVRAGGWCGSTGDGKVKHCPDGMVCGPLPSNSGGKKSKPWWCLLFYIHFSPGPDECQSGTKLQPTDWHCHPPP